MRQIQTVLLGIVCICSIMACQRQAPISPSASVAISTTAATGPAAAAPTMPPAKRQSPYQQSLRVFEEFVQLAEEQQNTPDKGVEICRQFAATKIPELKVITAQIKAIETGPDAAGYLQEIMDSNDKIRTITDKVTTLAQQKYGANGPDLLLILSDLALARL
ncbi:MAG: hypothetical protein HYV03_06745 [Deltaproteobacteria bacterium]|nr:hypothetical protein [Deltaproteobacteria bacterium]